MWLSFEELYEAGDGVWMSETYDQGLVVYLAIQFVDQEQIEAELYQDAVHIGRYTQVGAVHHQVEGQLKCVLLINFVLKNCN